MASNSTNTPGDVDAPMVEDIFAICWGLKSDSTSKRTRCSETKLDIDCVIGLGRTSTDHEHIWGWDENTIASVIGRCVEKCSVASVEVYFGAIEQDVSVALRSFQKIIGHT